MSVDFAALAERLLSQSRSLLADWFPQGKLQGREFCVGDLHGSPGESLKINVETGRWSDFASGDAGGDLISLYAAMHGIKQIEAVKALDDGAILDRVAAAPAAEPVKKRSAWTPIVPVPEDAPKPTDDFWVKGDSGDWFKRKFINRWAYRDASGALLGYAVRFEWFEKNESRKDVVPQTYCVNDEGKRQWCWRSFIDPRPLYNLPDLAARPDAPVMIVEGEKKVEALRVLAKQYIGIAWPGGANAWRKVDWSPLKGRTITLWPDADKQVVTSEAQSKKIGVPIGDRIPAAQQPGMRAMWEIGHFLLKHCPTVKVIIPDDEALPDGWDCADAVAEGWDWQRFKTWALPRVVQLNEGGRYERQGRDGGGQADGGDGGGRDGQQGSPGGGDGDKTGEAARSIRGGDAMGPAAAGARDSAAVAGRGEAAGLSASTGRADDDNQRAAARRRGADGGDPAAGRDVRHDRDVRGATGTQARVVPSIRGSSGISAGEGEAIEPAARRRLSVTGRWLDWGLELSGNGAPICNLNNAVTVMERDEALRGLLWFDEFLQRPLTVGVDGQPREWTGPDCDNLQLHMQRYVGLQRMGLDTIKGAVRVMMYRDIRNSVKTWTESLTWDGIDRLTLFMSTVFGAEDTAFVRAVSRNFWISMVARIYQPGCKVDNMVVFEGSQGTGKSTALNIIGGDWFTEQQESAQDSKKFAEILQGKLIVEISEMDSFGRAEITSVKRIITCRVDRYRVPFDTEARDFKRQGIMAGTTNKDDWNQDETGARRFWPIACRRVNLDYLAEAREQLFAEAVAAFKAGEKWWLVPGDEAEHEQRSRFDADPWAATIDEWLTGRTRVAAEAIATDCLGFDIKNVDRGIHKRLAKILRSLGFDRVKSPVREGGKQRRYWVCPGDVYGGKVTAKGGATLEGNVNAGLVAEKVAQKDIPFQ